MTTVTARRFGYRGKGFLVSFHAVLFMAGFALCAPAAHAANTVGTAPGQFSVSPTGAATYQIPIDVPPGVNGLKPSLALFYNSQAGNGLMGQGWSLSGLSVISHCPQTIDQDGVAQMPFDLNTDRLCLDGERLVLISGTYGQLNSTYHTEIDSFRLVKVTGMQPGQSGGPTSFSVVDRAGLTSIYSTQVAGGNGGFGAIPLLWLVTSITDRHNNFINFQYNISNYSVANGTTSWDSVAQITYGHTGAAAVGQVVFSYGSRSDHYNQVIEFTPVTANPAVMTGITVEDGNGNALRTYTLSYQYSNPQQPTTPPTELTAVQECAGSICYPATTFTYDGSAGGFALGGGDTLNGVNPMPGFLVADFDGDGLPDYLFEKNNSLYVVFGNNSAVQVSVPATLTSSGQGGIDLQGALVMDLNGDGKQELLVPNYPKPGQTPNLPTWDMLAWNGLGNGSSNLNDQPVPTTNGVRLPACSAGNTSCLLLSAPMDIKRNGQPGLFYADSGNFYYYANVGGALNPSPVSVGYGYTGTPQPVPFDWQGRAAVYLSGQGTLYSSVIDWNPTANNGAGAFQQGVSGDGTDSGERTYLLDTGGDGLTDAVMVDGGQFFFAPNNGAGFNTANSNDYMQCLPTPSGADLTNIQVIDWYNDGRQQLILPVNNTWYMFDPTQCSFTNTNAPVPTHDPGSLMQLVDVNNDGQPDLIYTYNGHTSYALNLTKSYMINQIVDGVGHETDVGYIPLGAETGGAYTRNLTPPQVNPPQTRIYTGAMNIVKDFAADSGTFDSNGNSQQVYTYYLYAGAVVEQWGRGFLGFKQVEAINYNTGLYTTDTYRQDFPFGGMVASSSQTWDPTAKLQTGHVGAGGVQVRCTNANPAEPACNVLSPPTTVAVDFVTVGTTINNTTSCYADAYSPSNPAATGCPAGAAGSRVYPGVYSPYGFSSTAKLYDLHTGSLYETTTSLSTEGLFAGTPIGEDMMPTDINITTQDNTSGADVGVVDTQSTYGYEASCPGRPDSVTVTHTFQSVSTPSQLETFTYDNHCFLTQDQKTIVAATGAPGYPKTQTKTYTPDSYGNPLTSAISASDVSVARTTTMTYDATERFPATITNAFNQAEILSYDVSGHKLTDTDPNGNTVSYKYDGFGRPTKKSGPLPDVYTKFSYTSCGSGSPGCAYEVIEDNSADTTPAIPAQTPASWVPNGVADSLTEYDELGRAISIEKTGFNGEVILQNTVYDFLGRAVQTSVPYKSGGTVCWDVKGYDVLNRVTSESQPLNATQCSNSANGGSSERTITTAYNGLTTVRTTFDPGNTVVASEATTTVLNALGKPASVTDPEGITKYYYDAWGNLTSVTPVEGAAATVSMTYDSLGDKLSMKDPDMGAWSYIYNGFGELLSQTDAKGQTVTNNYDLLGRLVNRSEAEGVTRWAYDIGYGAGIGKLAYTVGPNGVWEGYAYDGFGEATDKITVVNNQEYWVTTTYDDQGRTAQVVYPTLNGINVSGTPAIPSGLTVAKDANDPTAFDLNWTLAQNGQIYHLYRTLSTATSPGDADEIYSGPAPNWQDSTITKTQTYTWWLKACNGNAPLCSAYASVTLAVTLPPTVPVPFAPGGVQPATSWPLSWTAANLGTTGTAGPISYVVQAQFNGGAWTPAYTGAGTTNDGGQTYSSPAVAGNGDGSYAYRVQSCASGSCSSFSAPATVSIAIQPSVPQSVTVPATVTPQTSPASIAVNWTAPAVNGGTANLSYTVAVYRNSALQRTSASQSATGFTDSETLDGTYSYAVTVCDTVNTSLCAPASSSNVAVTLPPVNPGVPTYYSDSQSPTWSISWTQSSSTPGNPSGTVSYKLQQSWNGGAFSDVTGMLTSGSTYWQTATAVLQGGYYQNGTYTYQLRACTTDSAVSITAACTAWISSPGSGYVTTIAPGVPTHISVPAQSNWDGSFTVTYSAPAASSGGPVTGYGGMVYDTACTDSGNCIIVPKATCTSTTTSCAFPANTLPAGNGYGLQIRANDSGVHGAWVQENEPNIVYTSPPPAPTINETDASDGIHYTITYSASTATTYQLYFSSSTKTGSWSAWTQVYSGSATSYYTTSPIGQYYLRYYAVACNQHAQCSPNSSVYSFTNPKEVTGCMTCSQTNPPTAPPSSGSTASAVSSVPVRVALAAQGTPAVAVPVTRVSAPDLELPVLRALATNATARPGSNSLKRLRLPHPSTSVARHRQTLAALTHGRAHASHLLATATLSPRQAYFLAHTWHTPKSLRIARVNWRHGKAMQATARYAHAMDPRLSLYPPLRRDPRVQAHFEARGGYLPAVAQDATLQEDCGSSTDACSEPAVGTALMVGYQYNTAGYLAAVNKLDSNGLPLQTLWQATDETAGGQVDQQTFDAPIGSTTGAFSIVDTYDAASGLLNSTAASGVAGYGLSATYTWDGYNNLLSRSVTETVPTGQTGSPFISESFTYDAVNRLCDVNVPGGCSGSSMMVYNPNGTFQSKGVYTGYAYSNPAQSVTLPDGSVYTYNQPHAVSSLKANGVTRNFTYDANGNLATESGDVTRTMNQTTPNSWTSYNKPNVILAGAVTESFTYGPSRERLATSVSNSTTGDTVTTTYVDGLFEQVQDSLSGNSTYRHYIVAGSLRVGVETLQANSGGTVTADTLSFFVHDEVGSVVAAVTENLGGSNQQLLVYSFNVWGKARPSSGSTAYVDPLPATYLPGTSTLAGQHEGFAGHEDLEDLGIVDMEGRIYDPEVGRFLSPDPNVQFPDSTQGYNRYTYVNNNPLSLSDPTGYYSFGAFASTGDPLAGVNPQLYGKLVGKAGMVASAVLNFVPGCQVWCGAAVTAVSQVQAGYLETGDIGDGIQQGVITGVEAFAFSETGQAFGTNLNSAELFERSVIEGVIGGAGAAADGGNFGSGFVGAFASSEAGPVLSRLGPGPGQMIVAALAGGTISSLTGGNFSDGAFAAALQNLFNEQSELKGDNEYSETVYGETAGIYPELMPVVDGTSAYTAAYTSANWDPDSAEQLTTAREWIAAVREANKITNTDTPADTGNTIEMRAWAAAVSASAARDSTMIPAGTKFFLIRQAGTSDLQVPPASWGNVTRVQSFGPFINQGGGDVSRGVNTYIDFYKRVPP